jgi:hypothetical protein
MDTYDVIYHTYVCNGTTSVMKIHTEQTDDFKVLMEIIRATRAQKNYFQTLSLLQWYECVVCSESIKKPNLIFSDI